ncbi:hypothetical protein V4C53_27830 [Paraburkholderia azotifigens]|uniref:hypothetical protein n=1 Tax=Paraburkholderia azotifigens TaxID=2057004 RepID=UPI00317BABC6
MAHVGAFSSAFYWDKCLMWIRFFVCSRGCSVRNDVLESAAIDRVAADGAFTARHGVVWWVVAVFLFVCDAVAVIWFLVFLLFAALASAICSFAGIREFVSVLHALPLCGAAPTFLCSGKEK